MGSLGEVAEFAEDGGDKGEAGEAVDVRLGAGCALAVEEGAVVDGPTTAKCQETVGEPDIVFLGSGAAEENTTPGLGRGVEDIDLDAVRGGPGDLLGPSLQDGPGVLSGAETNGGGGAVVGFLGDTKKVAGVLELGDANEVDIVAGGAVAADGAGDFGSLTVRVKPLEEARSAAVGKGVSHRGDKDDG